MHFVVLLILLSLVSRDSIEGEGRERLLPRTWLINKQLLAVTHFKSVLIIKVCGVEHHLVKPHLISDWFWVESFQIWSPDSWEGARVWSADGRDLEVEVSWVQYILVFGFFSLPCAPPGKSEVWVSEWGGWVDKHLVSFRENASTLRSGEESCLIFLFRLFLNQVQELSSLRIHQLRVDLFGGWTRRSGVSRALDRSYSFVLRR